MTGKKNKEIGSATSFQCPMLNNSNFNIWAIRMQVILEANDLWEVVEPQPTTQIDNKADKTAIAFIFQALPEDQILQTGMKKGGSQRSFVPKDMVDQLLQIADDPTLDVKLERHGVKGFTQ
ncbi:zinc finger, CCHC-type containing protein, partial [Tanacetum coccineum]